MFKIDGKEYQVYLTEKIIHHIKRELDKMPKNELITTKELKNKFRLSTSSGSLIDRLKYNFQGYYAKYKNGYVWGNKKTIELFKKTAGL